MNWWNNINSKSIVFFFCKKIVSILSRAIVSEKTVSITTSRLSGQVLANSSNATNPFWRRVLEEVEDIWFMLEDRSRISITISGVCSDRLRKLSPPVEMGLAISKTKERTARTLDNKVSHFRIWEKREELFLAWKRSWPRWMEGRKKSRPR